MNEDRLIEREYKHFIDIYSGADDTKLKIANDLFWKAAFLKVQLYALEDKIKRTGAVEYSNKGNSRVSLSYKTYLQSISVYQSLLKTIDKIMGSGEDDDTDEFDDFILKAAETRWTTYWNIMKKSKVETSSLVRNLKKYLMVLF